MQAIETERSPGLPSLIVTTRRRLMPHGTSCSFLQAVTQALHSMHRSASQRNFIRDIVHASLCRSDLTEADFGLLHPGCGVVAICHDAVGAFTQHIRIGAGGIPVAQVTPAEPAAKVEWHPRDAPTDTLGYKRFHLCLGAVLRSGNPDPSSVF